MVILSVSNSCSPDILCWNITQSAGAYSTLASVLAGFLVSAMIFSLQDRQNKHISIPLYASSVACLSFALSSFLFAMLAGAELTSSASTSLAYLLGSTAFGTFALSAIQLMLSIIWFFRAHEINASIIHALKFLIQFMIVVGILYTIKFSVDVLRVKSGDGQEYPWIFLLLLVYALYTYVVTRKSVSFIRKKWDPLPEEEKSKIAKRLLHGFSFSGIQLEGLSMIVLSSYTGIFIIGLTLIYGLLATDFINWLSSFNKLNYSFYLYFTIFIYVVSPLYFILVQLSFPDVKSIDSRSTSDTQANLDEEARV